MPYTAEISRANPTCFVFLIDQSGSMADSFGGGGGKRKADGVADAINRLLQTLVLRCSTGESVYPRYDVGVIGYGATVGPAFGGALARRSLVPISEVANAPVRIEERSRKVEDGAGGLVDQTTKFPVWFDPIADGGTPMGDALRHAYQLLHEWVSRHQASYPPIVINITDGEATDGDPTPPAQTLARLSTADGPVLVFNCHISAHVASPIMFPDSEAGLPDQYARLLFHMSSVLPGNLCAAARSEGFGLGEQARGFAFNAHLVDLIRFLDIGTRPSNLR
jgi:hypothetical protein